MVVGKLRRTLSSFLGPEAAEAVKIHCIFYPDGDEERVVDARLENPGLQSGGISPQTLGASDIETSVPKRMRERHCGQRVYNPYER